MPSIHYCAPLVPNSLVAKPERGVWAGGGEKSWVTISVSKVFDPTQFDPEFGITLGGVTNFGHQFLDPDFVQR